MPDQHPDWWDLPLLQSRQTQAATDPVTVDRPPAPHPFTAGHRTPTTSHNGTAPTLGLAHRGDSPEPRRTPRVPPHPPAAPVPAAPAAAADLDWSAVRKLRLEAADRLAGRLRDSHGMDPATQREVGRAVVTRVVTEHAEKSLASGGAILSPEQTHAMVSAVMDSLFGLGRLQPLVNLPTVENIEVRGVDNVVLQHNDGRIEPGPPVGETDEELIEQLQFLAARSGEQERPFSPAFPFLNLGLPGNIRLAAAAWVGARPSVWIRRHRLNTATLGDLVELGMMDNGLAGFLAAAVRARMSIVVSGPQGAGKALALDTEVPTPGGWTTMGALNTGDQVFAEDGTPCTVLEAHDYQFGRTCYEVEFDDGTTVVADADHLWRVSKHSHRESARRNRRKPPPGPTFYVSTEERDRLWAYAGAVASSPDRQVTVAEFAGEVGDSHLEVVRRCAQRLTPRGHTYLSWTRRDGRRGGRPMLSYSRHELATALAVARDTPRPGRSRLPDSVVLTTQDIADSPLWAKSGSWRTYNFTIPLSAPVQYPATTQPIDPYVLGVWLGDGSTAGARITTADAEVITEIQAAGYPCTPVKGRSIEYGVGGNLQVKLRLLNLLGDKHIPATYLRASVDQRVALLHGLMDSDGTCGKNGRCEYTTTLQVLGEQVHDLVRSLGYKATLATKPVRWKNDVVGTAWTVSWATRDPMFRLPRKRERQGHNGGGPVHRAIVGVRRVDSVPVRCISVDSPSSLFLITRSMIATHNTTLMRAMCQVIDPWESVVTIEGEPELLLDQLGRFHRITSWLTRPSAGETTSRGEVTLDELGHHALRTNADRVIVGEVRGAEVAPMVKAMESGAGSLSTTHTVRGRAVISRLALLLAETRGIPRDTGVAMVAQTVQLIVHVDKDVTTRVDGSTPPRRFVREVIAVEMGEHGKPAYTDVYRPGPSGDAVPGTLPAWLTHLDQFGFDRHEHAAGVQR